MKISTHGQDEISLAPKSAATPFKIAAIMLIVGLFLALIGFAVEQVNPDSGFYAGVAAIGMLTVLASLGFFAQGGIRSVKRAEARR